MDEVRRQATFSLKSCVARHITEVIAETLEDLGASYAPTIDVSAEGRNWIRLRFESDLATGPGRRKVREFKVTITETVRP